MKRILALLLCAAAVTGLLAGCRGRQVSAETYTYHYALPVFPTNWNPNTYQTTTDAQILDYITDGFYTFDYNADFTGYALVDAMAVGDPQDVTEAYVGQYGIREGDTALAYVLTIRDDLRWNNGDGITAYDFEESAKRLLDPQAKNYRADSLYSGSVSIYGAEQYVKQTDGTYSWDQVGWKALDDTHILFVLNQPMSGFYLKYNLPVPLVHIPTYDACGRYEAGIYTNTYGTTAATTMSYGPYTLTDFQADKEYTLAKNPHYYGHGEGVYQTTHIVVSCVAEASTRLELFLQGKLDSYSLQKEDLQTYQRSEFTYFVPGTSTFAITFNPDRQALERRQAAAGANVNKTILTIPQFRMAMSFALDRTAFCLATAPTNGPAVGLYSPWIVSDPEAGTAYRDTQWAKEVLAEFWGVRDAVGTLYADLDEAVAAITGYNLTKARQLFDEAYRLAVSQGLMKETDVVVIKIGVPNSASSFYSGGYTYLVNCYTQAVQGTALEGKLRFEMDDTIGNDFADALKTNQVDMLFGVGWSGSALDPYGLMEVYVSPVYQYDAAFDYTKINLDVELDGTVYTATVWQWYEIMNGKTHTITAADGTRRPYTCGPQNGEPENRLKILAALEGAILLNYNFIPIMDAASATMRGMQIQYKTEEYIQEMEFGGVKYFTYRYSDAAWEEYVAGRGGKLDYT